MADKRAGLKRPIGFLAVRSLDEAGVREFNRNAQSFLASFNALADRIGGGEATLAQSATETTVTDRFVGSQSFIVVGAASASALAAAPYLKSIGSGSFVIGHSSSAATDMLVHYVRFG